MRHQLSASLAIHDQIRIIHCTPTLFRLVVTSRLHRFDCPKHGPRPSSRLSSDSTSSLHRKPRRTTPNGGRSASATQRWWSLSVRQLARARKQRPRIHIPGSCGVARSYRCRQRTGSFKAPPSGPPCASSRTSKYDARSRRPRSQRPPSRRCCLRLAILRTPPSPLPRTQRDRMLRGAAPVKSSLADWAATEEDEYMYGTGEKRPRGGRRKKKKRFEMCPWRQIGTRYTTLPDPTNVDEYLRSDERIREVQEWKALLYKHRRRENERDSWDSDEEDDHRPANSRSTSQTSSSAGGKDY